MRTIEPQELEWLREGGVGRATLHTEGTTQAELLEVEPGQSLRPHKHSRRRQLLVVVFASGAQLRIGDRVFRPVLGQAFEREPGEVMEIVNDTTNAFRMLSFQLGYDAADVQQA